MVLNHFFLILFIFLLSACVSGVINPASIGLQNISRLKILVRGFTSLCVYIIGMVILMRVGVLEKESNPSTIFTLLFLLSLLVAIYLPIRASYLLIRNKLTRNDENDEKEQGKVSSIDVVKKEEP
jgi:hypothetical protein